VISADSISARHAAAKNFTGCDNYRHLAEKIEKIFGRRARWEELGGLWGWNY